MFILFPPKIANKNTGCNKKDQMNFIVIWHFA
jgi:hypothetical protein